MESLTRRKFISIAAVSGVGLTSLSAHDQFARGEEGPRTVGEASDHLATPYGDHMPEEINKEKIRRAMLAGPSSVTAEATVAEIDHQGNLTIIRPGTNEGVCIPGDQNVVGRPDMALDPMGMIWFKDVLARKPKPTNTSPGLIYMLNGANAEELYGSIQHAESAHPNLSALDDPLAIRRESGRSFHRDAGRGHDGDVRGYAVRTPAPLWVSM